MRAADRWQMVEFERELAEQALKPARMTSEGLVKYVDSLSSINQREVLQLHDSARDRRDARGALDRAPAHRSQPERGARADGPRVPGGEAPEGPQPGHRRAARSVSSASRRIVDPGENAKYLEKLEQCSRRAIA